MQKVILIIFTIILLAGCAREVSEVIEKYDNGNWKKELVYKVKGDKRQRVKLIEYDQYGQIIQEIDLEKNPDYQITSSQPRPATIPEEQAAPTPPDNDNLQYNGPYADMMNQPGVVTRKLEGEEKQRVLEAMRKQKEEQYGEKFTEISDNGEEMVKYRKILEEFEDGSVKHEQIFSTASGSPELEKDIVYYANGQIRTFVPYTAGIASGRWLNYYRNGALKTEGHSKNGTHNGEYIQYYENGLPMMKGQFVDGKMEGKWQHFWENGNLQMETVFKDDREIGPTVRYNKNGEKEKRQSPFRVGEQMDFGTK